jgi:hypothetical protein
MHEITITLARGNITRAVTPEALARELGVATVQAALLALLLRPDDPELFHSRRSSPSGEPTEGERSLGPNVGSNGRNVGRNVNVQENIIGSPNVNERSFPEKREALSEDASVLATELADKLEDHESLPWFRQVAETLDPLLIRDALACALNLPAHRLRRSRAAYFTSIVAPFVRRTRSTQPYAQTPSAS